MRTLNVKTNHDTPFTPWAIKTIDITGKQPCWSVTIEDRDNRSETKWVLRVKEDGRSKVEYLFILSDMGNVDNEIFWNKVTSLDFAIELLAKFRDEGKQAAARWVSNMENE